MLNAWNVLSYLCQGSAKRGLKVPYLLSNENSNFYQQQQQQQKYHSKYYVKQISIYKRTLSLYQSIKEH